MIYCPKYNITVGPEEEAVNHSNNYDLILNVSDTAPRGPKANETKWFPIQEMSNWGYGPFYWSKKILDEAVAGKIILLHCHAGVNRSPAILVGYLLSLGFNFNKIKELGIDDYYIKSFNQNLNKNHIPSDILMFYRMMEKYPEYSLMGILHSMGNLYAH